MNPEQSQAHQSAALSALQSLLEAHFDEAQRSADDEGKFSISFRVTFDRSHPQTHLKVTSRINTSITDEIETHVGDPRQPELVLEGRGSSL